MKQSRMAHIFVNEVPTELAPGVLYVAMDCATAIHRCACGCGQEVVTPFSPTDWTLIFDGDTVSLDPSVGNWSLPCRSHYFIDRGAIAWAGNMSNAAIELGRARDRKNKSAYFSNGRSAAGQSEVLKVLAPPASATSTPCPRTARESQGSVVFWSALKSWWKD
ncbi:DUF6527 family protein [Variovorax atrisoli]|uniref:DUF6527 family protein n=1 Tax=Variovorax atrisoli TaxID=3394203 RepID=UPI0009B7DFEA|nr:DUF6527 family protein [Variovorax paradoxus]